VKAGHPARKRGAKKQHLFHITKKKEKKKNRTHKNNRSENVESNEKSQSKG
jgi:hypothetical protein